MAAAARPRITHFAWPEGLAIVIDVPDCRTAALFGPRGWQVGEAAAVFPDGPPEESEATSLVLPKWLAGQMPSLAFEGGGLHTDFLRVHRLVERLRGEGADGAVFVLGRAPAAVVIAGGRATVLEPPAAEETRIEDVLAAADGWVVVLSGPIRIPVPASAKSPRRVVGEETAPAVVAPELIVEEIHPAAAASEPIAEEPQPAADVPEPIVEPVMPIADHVKAAPETVGAAASADEERFLVSPGAVQSLPADVATELRAIAGDAGFDVAALLDGSRTSTEVALTTGLRPEQVSAVVKALVAHKLAFRYVSRARRPAGVRMPG